jgi:hypothetical protein
LRYSSHLARCARLPAFHHGSCLRDSSSRRRNSGQASCGGCHAPGYPAGFRPHFQRAPRTSVIVLTG